MDEHFYNDDFEKFLQQQVKHHRMYPSDAVWKGIYSQMHGYKKWPGLYFFAILIVASLTVCTILIETEPIVYAQQHTAKATSLKYDQLNPEEVTANTLRTIIDNSNITDNHVFATKDIVTPAADPVQLISLSRPVEIAATYDALSNNRTISTELNNPGADVTTENLAAQLNNTSTVVAVSSAPGKKRISAEPLTDDDAVTKKKLNPVDEYLEQHPEETDRIAQQKIRTRTSKWQLQFYIAPSMNYRVIVDEKTPDGQSAGPVATNYGMSASKVIRYNPGMGIEFGIGALYNLNSKLKIKVAVQYNVRQYNIAAYAGSTELAKIALVRGGNVDTLTAISRYRSTGLYGEAQLTNKYHQVSLPVGLEYTLFSSKRFGLNLGGTLQPTYTFSQSSYLLTSDYKSYANGKSILRKWNLNSSLEAMFTYKARNVQWRFGPQLRYQHLPNYTDAYPIKEYLIDYGFKIGFTKAIR
jgi:hypothetical protein